VESDKIDNKIKPFQVDSEIDFALFYNRFYPRFVRYAFYYLNDYSEAEDIALSALTSYWENREEISSETDVLGYIITSVKNKCLNHLKHLKIQNEYNNKTKELYDWEINARIQVLENASYSKIFSEDIMDIVKQVMAKLPEQTQKIFILNKIRNYSRKEIAKMFGISQTTVDYHVNKAIERLLVSLRDYTPAIALLCCLTILFQKI